MYGNDLSCHCSLRERKNAASIESVILCHFPLSADNYKYYSWKMIVTRARVRRSKMKNDLLDETRKMGSEKNVRDACEWDFWTERLWQLTKFMNIISFNGWTAAAAMTTTTATTTRMYPAHLNARVDFEKELREWYLLGTKIWLINGDANAEASMLLVMLALLFWCCVYS